MHPVSRVRTGTLGQSLQLPRSGSGTVLLNTIEFHTTLGLHHNPQSAQSPCRQARDPPSSVHPPNRRPSSSSFSQSSSRWTRLPLKHRTVSSPRNSCRTCLSVGLREGGRSSSLSPANWPGLGPIPPFFPDARFAFAALMMASTRRPLCSQRTDGSTASPRGTEVARVPSLWPVQSLAQNIRRLLCDLRVAASGSLSVPNFESRRRSHAGQRERAAIGGPVHSFLDALHSPAVCCDATTLEA